MLLRVEGLKRYFKIDGRTTIRAVDDVSFDVEAGEFLGVIGESGSGKSTLGRCIMRICKPDAGRVIYKGRDIYSKNIADFGPKVQMIFQNAAASLNPRMSVESIVEEPLLILGFPRKERISAIRELLSSVGMDSCFFNRRAGELSGGQCQRVAIARALAPEPELIIADEPISSLDISMQANIMNLFSKIPSAFVFISHDIEMIRNVSDRVAIMRSGKIIEISSSVFENPKHAYTKELLSSVPKLRETYKL